MIETFYNRLQDDIHWEGYRHLLAQKGILTINHNNEQYDPLFLLKILSIQEVKGITLPQIAQSLQHYLSLSRLLRLPPKPLPNEKEKEKKTKDNNPTHDTHHTVTISPLPDEETLSVFRKKLAQQQLIEPLIMHLYGQLRDQANEHLPRKDAPTDEDSRHNPDESQAKPDVSDDYDYSDYESSNYEHYSDHYEDAFSFMPPDSQPHSCPECGSTDVRQQPSTIWKRLLRQHSSFVCLSCANHFD